MRRLISFVVLLTLVLGATSLFSASADWKGYFRVNFRSIAAKLDDADQPAAFPFFYKGYDKVGEFTQTFFWQKLELYPSIKLSDNVTLNAGIYAQNFWGLGRLYGFETSKAIAQDTGSFRGSGSEITPVYLSSAWAVLSFMDGSLTIDIGRRKNPYWGTGVFFGSTFTPDRIFIAYRFSGFGGMNIPYFIFEDRNNWNTNSGKYKLAIPSASVTGNNFTQLAGGPDDSLRQILFGWIYNAPGKSLIGITINPNWVAKNWTSRDSVIQSLVIGGTPPTVQNIVVGPGTINGDATVFWAADLYADYKLTFGDISVKPIFEVVYGTGKVYSKAKIVSGLRNGNNVSETVDFYADVLNFIAKVETSMKGLFTLTPEFAYVKAPKKAKPDKWYSNFWGVNQFCPGEYKVGLIFETLAGYTSTDARLASGSKAGNIEYGGSYYIKVELKEDILNQFVKGLGAYVRFIMANELALRKVDGVETKDDSKLNAVFNGYANPRPYDKKIVMEFDAIAEYAVDSYTKLTLEFGYAKWGKSFRNDLRTQGTGLTVQGTSNPLHAYTAGFDKRGAKETYLGTNLVIKF